MEIENSSKKCKNLYQYNKCLAFSLNRTQSDGNLKLCIWRNSTPDIKLISPIKIHNCVSACIEEDFIPCYVYGRFELKLNKWKVY